MNEEPTKLFGKRIILRRIRLSLVLGTCITVVFGLILNFLPFRIGKLLFWPALPFVRVYDEQLGAPFYYLVGVPLAVLAYSLAIYIYLTARGWPHSQAGRIEGYEKR